jgi:MFS family permease
VTVVNNGTRRGTEVVQVYMRAPESLVRRPDRELVGFAKVVVDAGGRETVRLSLGAAAFRYWDVDDARVAHRPRPLRAARGQVVPRHLGQHRDHVGCPAGVVTERPWTLTWDRLLVEPRRPEVIRERSNAHWYAVAAVCVGAFMGQLDASIVTVALPTLQRTFGVSVGAVTWVGLSYLLVLVATVIAVGRFADMWGRKLLYVYGFLLFTAASALCGFAPDLAALCGFRALQAIGAAMLQANSLAIIVLVVPSRSLGRAIGLQGAAQALGLALGPTIGGLLLAAGGWRLIFFVNVPFGLLGPLAAVCWCPAAGTWPRVRFDWTGLGIFFPAVVALVSAISFGAELGWSSSVIVGLFVAAALLLGLFIWHERRDRDPMLDLSLFANARFSTGIVSGVGSYLVMFGILLLIPFYLERGLGLGVARAGLELMAMPLAFGIVAPLAGRLADQPRRPGPHRDRDGAGGVGPVPTGRPPALDPRGCWCCWP